jgi:hypothetical protein
VEGKFLGEIGAAQEGGRCKFLLDGIESFDCFWGKLEGFVRFLEGVIESGSFFSELLNEVSVVGRESSEGSDFSSTVGDGEVHDGGNLFGISADAFLVDNVAKEFDFMAGKSAFLGFGKQAVLSESFEDFLEDLKMFFKSGGEDRDVIDKNKANFSDEV